MAQTSAKKMATHMNTEPDEQYALVSVMYHAMQGAETAQQYSEDARAAGDKELIEFFADLREEALARAARAKALYVDRCDDSMDDESDVEDESDED